ncbi:hypothetical protein DIZ27_32850 [Streptomyces sp. NWU339]|uniref:hypothetical protein n=1 Tax=Streptomyces sp. NWU339 TaxID=2185284 RepID=UPI000D6852E0|nr:hypothetical protein [Streptomyces sp. NWU339]PWI06531.1 hypothetical protein DIZ27_32850 [Streptomyces sp. NWU339]
MAIQTSPCEPWPLDLDCCPAANEADEETVEKWRRVATTILFHLSGRRWGPSCPFTVRPCRRRCLDSQPLAASWSGSPWVPYIGRDGNWYNASVCGCSSDCSCGELCEVRLEGPVHDIVSVQIDGVELPPETYRVDDAGLLVRQDGGCWPDCQNMGAPLGEPDTFGVTYRVGLPLDDAAEAAFAELVCHLLKGCNGGGSCGCKMPANVTRLSRQGVDQEFADPTLVYSEMRTGLPLVDLWLTAVNPYRQTSPSRVYSPDFRRPRAQTWPR